MNSTTRSPLICTGIGCQRGFTLVECLVAMVVISVGLLGIAALYVEGLRAGRTSVFRMSAIDLASDMADRIRANPAAGNAYAGAGAENDCADDAGDFAPAQLAADDVYCWQQTVQTLLPAGAGNIGVVAGAGSNTYTISVTWSEPGMPDPLDYILSVQL